MSPFRLLASILVTLALVLSAVPAALAQSAPINVVAIENFYGDIASQIGGSRVAVISILADPSIDPHEYEPTVVDAKAIGAAALVIKNGVGYDTFADKLLKSSPRPDRQVIDVGILTNHTEGDNPHLWYDVVNVIPPVTQGIVQSLSQADPAGAGYYAAQAQTFRTSLQPIYDQIAAMQKYKGAPILATEPVFNYMATAAGVSVLDAEGDFQKATQEGADPPAYAVVKFRNQLTNRQAIVLLFNNQAVTPMSEQMSALASSAGIPVVPVTETQPPGQTYQQWQLGQLQALFAALGG